MNEDPGQGTVQQQPGPGDGRPVERSGLRALWLGMGAMFGALFFAPLGLVAGVAAVVIAVRTKRRARGSNAAAPGSSAGLVMGWVGLLLSAMSLAVTVFLWPELSEYQECLSRANTNTDEQVCRDRFFPKIEDKLGQPRGSMSKYENLFG